MRSRGRTARPPTPKGGEDPPRSRTSLIWRTNSGPREVARGSALVDHAQMRLVELSHTVEHGMITYPGLPGPVIGEHMSFDDSADRYDPGTEFTIGRISMVSNTGTYLDTPGHRFRGAHDLAGLPLKRCALLPA